MTMVVVVMPKMKMEIGEIANRETISIDSSDWMDGWRGGKTISVAHSFTFDV